MITILHISDLHFGPPYVPAAGEALLACVERLRADVIVASGDFTQRAKREQFAAARDFLARLPQVPLVVTPGNHDIPLYRVAERLLTPYDLYREYIAPELTSVLRCDGAVFVSLNTTDPLRRITGGRLPREQYDICTTAFRDAPTSAARIVVAHHPFAPPPDLDRHRGDMTSHARQALDHFTHLEVDLILGGHLHRAYIGNSLDVYPSDDRTSGIVIAQSGTTTSRRGRGSEREKNTFNLIEISDEQIHITHYMYFESAGGFVPLSRHWFPRRRHSHLAEPTK